MNSSKATKVGRRGDKNTGQEDNQRSGTGMSQTRSPFSLLIVVVKENIAEKNIFLISHLGYMFKYLIVHLGRKIKSF